MADKIYDTIIIGGGPAGYTAGIYAARDNLDTLLLEREISGGIAGITDLIDNYPGFPEGITGMDLMQQFKKQGEKFGVQIQEFAEVQDIHKEESYFHLTTDKETYRTRTVIIATGGTPRKLQLKKERALLGRGVSYCATCDGPFYKDAEIAVVGGGDAAVQEALYLTKFAQKVTVIHRRDQLRAAPYLQDRAFANDKIRFQWDSVVADILGEEQVEGLQLKNVKTGTLSEIKVEGVFIFIGWTPNTDFVKELLELDEVGWIVTDGDMNTSVKGIYAVGDVRAKKFRQISTAVGDGTTGALAASEYVSILKES